MSLDVRTADTGPDGWVVVGLHAYMVRSLEFPMLTTYLRKLWDQYVSSNTERKDDPRGIHILVASESALPSAHPNPTFLLDYTNLCNRTYLMRMNKEVENSIFA